MSPSGFHDLLRRVTEGEFLDQQEAADALDAIISGDASDLETAALLAAWKTRGETAEEVAGFVETLRRRMLVVEHDAKDPVDTCGTGGDGFGTFNVSTTAALVAAGAGVPVAKHGNRAVSSRSGSADVLRELGLSLDVPAAAAGRILAEVGIVFLFAPSHHPALARVAPIRRTLRLRTVFNIVGPLVNPARVKRQVIGVYRAELLELVAATLQRTGVDHAWVVHGDEGRLGLDELTTTGPTLVHEVRGGAIRRFEVRPEDVGLSRVGLAALQGGDAVENAALVRRILEGEEGPCRDVVLLNAAAAIHVAGRAGDLAEGLEMARRSIDEGKASSVLAHLVEATRREAEDA